MLRQGGAAARAPTPSSGEKFYARPYQKAMTTLVTGAGDFSALLGLADAPLVAHFCGNEPATRTPACPHLPV